MNGYAWRLDAKCTTEEAASTFEGPAELVRHEMERWLGEHDRHEFTFRQTIVRPADAEEAFKVPEFMREVEVSDRDLEHHLG